MGWTRVCAIFGRIIRTYNPDVSRYREMSGALRHRSLCHLFCKLHKKESLTSMLPLHYNDSVWYVNRLSGYGSVPHGFPVPRIELGSWPWKGHILPLDYTGGVLFRALYHWVVSINRPSGYEPDALPLRHNDWVSLGGFDPPPLGLLVCIHYTTMGGFDPPPLIPPVCDHTLQRRVLISAPPSHISVTAFTVSRLTTSMTFYPVGIYYH